MNPAKQQSTQIEDIQSALDLRNLAINQVGVKNIRHPVKIKEISGSIQNTVAVFNMYVHLPHNIKGTHMSRFVEILNVSDRDISIGNFEFMLNEMVSRLEAQTGHIEMRFPYFINKTAPVSGVKSLMDYEVSYIGEIRDEKSNITIKVAVPVTSLCPCSKKISSYGAHNQRSIVTITVLINSSICVEDLIRIVEMQASSELFSLLKRPDEKFITERAYDNPKFVEDMVRDVATQLKADIRIKSFSVECENLESIHNHSAFAKLEGVR